MYFSVIKGIGQTRWKALPDTDYNDPLSVSRSFYGWLTLTRK